MTTLLQPLGKAFAMLSLAAVGGANAAVPEIRRIVVERHHWMDGAEFSHLFAIAQAAPGPNVLFVSLIGWRLAGFAGLLVCTLAMNVPSTTLAFVAGRAWRRWSSSLWISRLRATLTPIAVGLIAASGFVMAKATDHAVAGWSITALVAAYVIVSRHNLLWALGSAALAGVVLSRLKLGL